MTQTYNHTTSPKIMQHSSPVTVKLIDNKLFAFSNGKAIGEIIPNNWVKENDEIEGILGKDFPRYKLPGGKEVDYIKKDKQHYFFPICHNCHR